MKATEYIAALQALIDEHGDLEVQQFDFITAARKTADIPDVSYQMILTGKQRKNRFWSRHDDENLKGQKVIRV